MGIVFATGFEMGAVPLSASENPSSFGVESGGIGGVYYAYVHDYNRWIQKDISALNLQTVYTGVWCTHSDFSGQDAGSLQFVYAGKTIKAKIQGYRVNILEGSTLRASGSKVLPASETYFHLQLGVTAAGVFTVRIDGVQDAQWDSSGSQGNVQSVRLESGQYAFRVDNWVIRDDTWPGDVRLSWLAPSGDDTPNQWTCTSGSDRYALVDEVPPNDADYIYTSTHNYEQWLAMANWNGTNKTPLAVMQWLRAYKDTAGSQQVRYSLDDGGVQDHSSYFDLATSAAWYGRLLASIPGGGSWTESHINALKYGLKANIP